MGAEVFGRAGVVAAPQAWRLDFDAILELTIHLGTADRKLMQRLAGLAVAAFSFKPELLCLLHRTYTHTETLRDNAWRPFPLTFWTS